MPKVARTDDPAPLSSGRADLDPDAEPGDPAPDPARRGKSVKSATPPVPAPRARRAAAWAFTPGRLLAAGLIPLCAAASLFVARRLPDLGARPGYALTAEGVRLDPPPARPVPADLPARVLGEEPVSILDDGLAARLAAAFKKHPWVRRVEEVRLSHPARADVRLVYRAPAAAVAVRAGLYPVDAGGVLLPPADFTRRAAEDLPRIEGPAGGAFAAPGPAGTLWRDDRVAGAAKICEELAGVWAECDLAAVRPLPAGESLLDEQPGPEVVAGAEKSAGGDVRYELVTRRGSRIAWGRAPGSGHPGELGAADKRRRLVGEVRRLLADVRGPQAVDLTGWDGIYYQPLPPARVGAADDFGGRPH